MINIISIFMFVSVVVGAFLFIHIANNGKAHYMKFLAAVVACVMVYIFAYAIEIHSNSLETALFWNGVQYLVIPIIATLWLTTVLLYVGVIKNMNAWIIKVIFIVPLITYILRYTNSYFFLYYSNYTFKVVGELGILSLEKSPWYYVQQIYTCLEILAVVVIFWVYSFKEDAAERYRYRLLAAISGASSITLLLLLVNPLGGVLDYTAVSFPVILFTLAYFIAKEDLFEISAMARNQFFDQTHEAMVIVSNKNKIVDYNLKAVDFFERNGIKITNADLTVFQDTNPKLITALYSESTVVYQEKIADRIQYFEMTSDMILNRSGLQCGVIKTIRNITEDYLEKENLEKMAKVDELTQLYNSREFNTYAMNLLAESDKAGTSLMMLMLDIDHFKQINDTFGHPTGDLVIQRIAKEAQAIFRPGDFIARTGGEEFVVILRDISINDAEGRANQYRERIEKLRMIPSDLSYQVTISIGLASYSRGMSLETLISHADKALYEAKDAGRNRVIVA